MDLTTELFSVLVAAALVNNLALVQLLGVSGSIAASGRLADAVLFASLTALVMAVTAPVNYLIQQWALIPAGMDILQLPVFVLVIAPLSILVCEKAAGLFPLSTRRLGWLTLLTGGNSAVLGLAILLPASRPGLMHVVAYSLGAAAGYVLITALLAAMAERLQYADIPQPFRGGAIMLLSAGLAAMALLGFAGLA